ncbi:MAG: hypothetical protein FGF48_09015 [Candidatus Brockarchaeota archaeon]|nr:hypothetical protein [Candidatus Brockarchaeota archaeon]
MASEAKHRIRMLGRDVNRRHVNVELDGERVGVERFSEEENKEWSEYLKSEKFTILSIGVGYVDFDHGSVNSFDKEATRKARRRLYRRKALAIYRLLWYFGPPYHTSVGYISSCEYLVKYRGFVFSIEEYRVIT